MGLPLSILTLVLLLALSAFFSGAETALLSQSRVQLCHRAAEGHAGAERALKLLSEPETPPS